MSTVTVPNIHMQDVAETLPDIGMVGYAEAVALAFSAKGQQIEELQAQLTTTESSRDGYKARCEGMTEALSQVQRVASANKVWAGDKWRYLGLTYVAQTKIVRMVEAALTATEVK